MHINIKGEKEYNSPNDLKCRHTKEYEGRGESIIANELSRNYDDFQNTQRLSKGWAAEPIISCQCRKVSWSYPGRQGK